MDLLLSHVALAIILFFCINWIGHHSLSAGYIQMSVLVKQDEAPAFNFLYRAFAPVVFITLCSALFYKFEAGWVVEDIYLVVIYYFVLRLIFNILTGRARLLNWSMQAAYWLTSIPVAFYVYENVIVEQQYFFPTSAELGNALWLAVLAFMYQTFNQVKLSNQSTIQRKTNYITHRYKYYEKLYGKIVEEVTADKRQQCLIFTIMIYEAFNRPKVYRLIEGILFYMGFAKTLGVMQVETDRLISDEESVRLGAQKIVDDHIKAQNIVGNHARGYGSYYHWIIRKEVIALYNRDDNYVSEVNGLYGDIIRWFYQDYSTDSIDDMDYQVEES